MLVFAVVCSSLSWPIYSYCHVKLLSSIKRVCVPGDPFGKGMSILGHGCKLSVFAPGCAVLKEGGRGRRGRSSGVIDMGEWPSMSMWATTPFWAGWAAEATTASFLPLLSVLGPGAGAGAGAGTRTAGMVAAVAGTSTKTGA